MRSVGIGLAAAAALFASAILMAQQDSHSRPDGRADAYVLSIENTWSTNVSIEQVERLRARLPGPFLWFRRAGKTSVIGARSLVEKARRFFAPLRDLEPEREALRRRQESLNEREQALEREQDDLERQLDRIEDAESDEDDVVAAPEETEALDRRREQVESRMRELEPEERELDGIERSLDSREDRIEREAERELWRLIDDAMANGTARKSPIS